MAKTIYVNPDTYWYLRRFKAMKRLKKNGDVLQMMFDAIKDKPDKFEIIFDLQEREKFNATKVGWTVQDDEMYWAVEEYGVNCKLKYQDHAVFNLIGHCQKILGDW